jgi:hypothetical protein
MIKNLIEAYLTTENENTVIQKVTEISALLPFLIGLPPDERRAAPKMGDASVPFVERALMYSKDQSSENPHYIETASLQRDYFLYQQIGRIKGILEPLMRKVNDSHMLLGAQSYQTSRLYYKYLGAEVKAGVPGAEAMYADLGERFKGQGRKKKTKPTDTTTTTTTITTSSTPKTPANTEPQEQKES